MVAGISAGRRQRKQPAEACHALEHRTVGECNGKVDGFTRSVQPLRGTCGDWVDSRQLFPRILAVARNARPVDGLFAPASFGRLDVEGSKLRGKRLAPNGELFAVGRAS
ncbi:hypothetical protein WT82_18000 [Burkholderia stagnalis]|nr:hypothetical protein WT82_18000 [Burkholderia stagnalis]